MGGLTRCRPGLDGQIMGGLSFGLSSAEEEKLKDVEGGRYHTDLGAGRTYCIYCNINVRDWSLILEREV